MRYMNPCAGVLVSVKWISGQRVTVGSTCCRQWRYWFYGVSVPLRSVARLYQLPLIGRPALVGTM